ncbi:MAG: hypothetical protein JWL81_3488 [Verrucomicrobiales bacterium]|nr:hypothetical protein [Verrucomicrobiales bacterium]
MTDDERTDLLKVVKDQAGELIAIDILLRALIASHPKPGDLKLALELLSTHLGVELRDHAFDTGRGPELTQSATADVQKHVDRWLNILADVQATQPNQRKE